MADISQVKLPNGDTYNLVDETSGYIKNYTETDPVFSASAAAGITATDISNWNAKVSDDKTWNGVTLNKQTSSPTWNIYLPFVGGTNNENAYYVTASTTPTANYISKYDANSYLYSTTPSANDNSTKVATTAYVDGAVGGITVPTKVSDLTNDSGFITTDTKNTAGSTDSSSKLFLIGATSQAANSQTYSHDTAYVGTDGCLYSGGVKTLVNNYSAGEYTYLNFTTDVVETQGVEARAFLSIQSSSYDGSLYRVLNYIFNSHNFTIYSQTLDKTFIDIINYSDNNFGDNNVGIYNLRTPTANADAATKKYVDDSIPKVYSSTNTGGYLTMATLPIYDGTVV